MPVSRLFSSNTRLASAQDNRPPMRYGERGEAVELLQASLLELGASMPGSTGGGASPPDGIYGNETVGVLRSFQSEHGLSVDGVAGRQSITRLDQLMAERDNLEAEGTSPCGNCRTIHPPAIPPPASTPGPPQPRFQLASAGGQSFAGGSSLASFSLPKIPSSTRKLSGAEIAEAEKIFRGSIDYERVLLTNGLGLQGRPFAMAGDAIPTLGNLVPPFGYKGMMLLFVGPAPGKKTLIHELTHAWQSQHHTDPTQYMKNAVRSQAEAELAALRGGAHATASAYKFTPGRPFREYAAEQIAEQVEWFYADRALGDKRYKGWGTRTAPIVKHIRSAAPVADPENIASLKTWRWQTQGGWRRASGTV